MAMTMQQARANVRTASGLDVLAGLWLIIAPFVLGYSFLASALWNSIIFGAAIVVLSATRTSGEGYLHSWPSWMNVIIGLWLIIAPFALQYAFVTAALWNSVIMGIVVVVLATWSALSTPREFEPRV